jgi:hypothetical protein
MSVVPTTAPPTSRPPPRRAASSASFDVAPAQSANRQGRRMEMSDADTVRADRIVLYAGEGFGKSTLGAYSPKPVFMMARGEDGLFKLLEKKLVPPTKCYPVCETWLEAFDCIDDLTNSIHDRETLVFDALDGFEKLDHEHVCQRDYGGNWADERTGFLSFQKGYERGAAEWQELLQRLERLQAARNMRIIFLAHAKVITFKNPVGPDYDKYVAECNSKTWAVTRKWVDVMFFGKFFTVVEGGKTGEKARKGKGIGGQDRVIYTEQCDAWDAKNRYGMPPEFEIPNDRTQSWTAIENALKGVQQ